VIADEKLRRTVRLWFNDGDPQFAADVEENVMSLPGVDTLQHKPVFTNKVVSKAMAKRPFSIPTMLFADPCGYKGLSLALITNALQGFGSDTLFFFNYSRVNMKLSYQRMDDSINEFFEKKRADALRKEIALQKPPVRERMVLKAIKDAIKEAKGIPAIFAFRTREGGGTSHHLVFASKHPKGAGIMKRIMTTCSSEVIDGVGSFAFDPSDAGPKNRSLFSPLDDIGGQLLERFTGRTLTFRELLDAEAGETMYTETNYREALLRLEADFHIRVTPPANERRKGTFAPGTTITFPT
jgi:three-Cys-motif partner protein